MDDDEDDFVLTRAMFSEIAGSPYELDWVQTYDEGLAAIVLQERDVFLVDYRLGERDGLDLLLEAQTIGCSTPLIMLSGWATREVDVAALEAGAADFLPKARLSADRLERSIRYSLERSANRVRLEELVRSKDEFVASVSHELRTPLTAVLGFAELLREQWSDRPSEEALEMVGLIVRQAQDAANIVSDLLVAAALDRVSILTEVLDVHVEVGRAVADLQLVDDVVVVVARPGIEAYGDPVRFRQIIRNLLVNAVRYGGERIGVDVSGDNGWVTTEVWDDGAGVSDSQMADIFEPYERVYQSAHQPGAMGLGLSVSCTLAELMGGDLSYRHSGGRSLFRLILPDPPGHREDPANPGRFTGVSQRNPRTPGLSAGGPSSNWPSRQGSRHRFRDRIDAGRFLGDFLTHLHGAAPLVLGIPRGGVVIAVEVAEVLDGEVGCVLAAKVGAPWSRELAIVAVAPDGVALLDEQMIDRMSLDPTEVEAEVARSLGELRRRQEVFGSGPPQVAGRVVIVADDGVATGSTLRAVLGYVRRFEPSRLVCAVPVGPPATIDVLASEVDEIVCPLQPERFRAVGEWYDQFPQTSDAEVLELLAGGS